MDQYLTQLERITSSPLYHIPSVALAILSIVGLAFIFKKAGKNPVLAIIPVVNFFVLTGIVTGKPAKALLMLIPIVNLVFVIKLCFDLAKVFGYDAGMGILTVFFAPITYIIIGTSKNAYNPNFNK